MFGRYAATADILKLNWLPIMERREFNIMKMTFEAIHNENWPSINRIEIKKSNRILRNSNELNLLHEVYGPSSSSTAPLRSKDGNNLLRDPKDILKRWREHFDEHLNRPSEVNQEFIDSIPCSSVKEAMADVPSIENIKAVVSKLHCGKSPGVDGLQAEIFKCAGSNLMKGLADLL